MGRDFFTSVFWRCHQNRVCVRSTFEPVQECGLSERISGINVWRPGFYYRRGNFAEPNQQGWSLQDQRQQFEHAVWPHLRGAYNLARWLTGNQHDAEDVVQESFIKAFRAVDRVRGEDARAWVLAIVRNTALNFLH